MSNRRHWADDHLNELNDHDGMWGPLLFLRPERWEVMSWARVLLISSLLGVFFGALGDVVLALLARTTSGPRPSAFVLPLLLTSTYFLCAQLSIVPAWNRRARVLSRRRA